MTRFWRGLLVGGAAGVMAMLWMNRRQRPKTMRQRMMMQASRTANKAQRRVGRAMEQSKRRASNMLAARK